MTEKEQTIITACRQGDPEKFGGLYDLYYKKIYNYIFYRVMQKETAEDLLQQIFLKALKNITKYDDNQGAFSTWLYKIAQNTLIDHYRTAKKHENIEDHQYLMDKTDTNKETHEKIMIEDIQKYLDELTESQKEIIILRIWDQMSFKEIAELTGKSEGSLKMAFGRAVGKLRSIMPEELYLLLLIHFIINN